MKHCQLCDNNDEEVLIIHHIDNNRNNNNSNNLMIICANCHLKIHHRKFIDKNNIINLKSEIFNDKRLKQELINLKLRDKKVDNYLKQIFKLN